MKAIATDELYRKH